MHRVLAGLVIVAGTLFPATIAGAHAQLIDSTPKDGAKLDTVPETIRLAFSEPPISGDDLVVEDGCGNDVVATAEANQTEKEIVATLSGGEPGRWKVSSRVVSTVDGHPTKDSFVFSVTGRPDCTNGDAAPPPRERDDGSSSAPLLIGLGAATALVVAGAFVLRKRG